MEWKRGKKWIGLGKSRGKGAKGVGKAEREGMGEAERKLIRGAWETPGACLELPRSSEELSGSHQEEPLRVSACSYN